MLIEENVAVTTAHEYVDKLEERYVADVSIKNAIEYINLITTHVKEPRRTKAYEFLKTRL